MSEQLQRPIRYAAVPVGDLLSQPKLAGMEPAHARCLEQTVTLFQDGSFTDIADVTDDVSIVNGSTPTVCVDSSVATATPSSADSRLSRPSRPAAVLDG